MEALTGQACRWLQRNPSPWPSFPSAPHSFSKVCSLSLLSDLKAAWVVGQRVVEAELLLADPFSP